MNIKKENKKINNYLNYIRMNSHNNNRLNNLNALTIRYNQDDWKLLRLIVS
jgi:hypothetical protein